MEKILEWKGAKPEDEKLAKKIAKKLQLEEIYFTYNVPLQISIFFNEDGNPKSGIDMTQSTILNYMPRKNICETFSLDRVFYGQVDAKDIKDFMKVSAIILEHLAEQFRKLNPAKDPEPCISYPNCIRQHSAFNGWLMIKL